MSGQLHLANVRHVLVRLEETIIFALIERAQFLRNEVIYRPGHFGEALEGESLSGFLLLECERSHAKVRRYTSPDEHPFFGNLPAPLLPRLGYARCPLAPNAININSRVRDAYENHIVPRICATGDDEQYGSSAVCDVTCLQALSKRVHYGKFVAETKYRDPSGALSEALRERDPGRIMQAITDAEVEAEVLRRVAAKARAYSVEIHQAATCPPLAPDAVVEVYREWIIPLNKQVQVEYLLLRSA